MKDKLIAVSINYTLEELINLKSDNDDFKKYIQLKKKKKKKKNDENVYRFVRGRQKVFNGFQSKVFLLEKQTQEESIKILHPTQMVQLLIIAPGQLNLGNKTKHLLNEIKPIICSLYGDKELTEKLCNNLLSSIYLQYKELY